MRAFFHSTDLHKILLLGAINILLSFNIVLVTITLLSAALNLFETLVFEVLEDIALTIRRAMIGPVFGRHSVLKSQ